MYFFYLDFLSVKLFVVLLVVLWRTIIAQSVPTRPVFVPPTTFTAKHLGTILAFHISIFTRTKVAKHVPTLLTDRTETLRSIFRWNMCLTASLFTIQAFFSRNTRARLPKPDATVVRVEELALRQWLCVWNNLLEDIVREEEVHLCCRHRCCCSVVWLLPRYSLSLGVNLFQFFEDCIFVCLCLCLDLYHVVVPLFGCCRDVLYFFNKIHFNFLRFVFRYTF